MDHPSLQVTFRKGRAIAAYYYLPRRDGDQSARVEQMGGGFLVDFTADGRPIGIEIPAPSQFDHRELNNVLVSLGQPPALATDVAALLGPRSVYETLDALRMYPAVAFGVADKDTLVGTMMLRLQAFLEGLPWGNLFTSDPPLFWFHSWLPVMVPWMDDWDNMAYQTLAAKLPDDQAFALFFDMLDQYRQTTAVILRRSKNQVVVPKLECPNTPQSILVGQFAPSPVCFTGIGEPDSFEFRAPFHSTLRRAMNYAKENWDVTFEKV